MARIKFYNKISNQWEYADANNIDSSSDIAIDHTLSKEGQAADAKAVGDALANKQPRGNYLTEVPSSYVTDEELNSKGYLTEHQDLSNYAKKTDIPSIPVQSVNGKIGAVNLSASDVGALPDTIVIPTVPTRVSAFTNDAGYLTEHQDISGKLDANKLPEAVENALVQAKESGEFDGYTPIKGTDYFTSADVQEIAEQAAGLVDVPDDDHINSLINTALGVVENGTY